MFRHQKYEVTDYDGAGGTLRFSLPDGNQIIVEAYVRAGYPVGLLVRGVDCALDVQPEVSNTIIIKPRS